MTHGSASVRASAESGGLQSPVLGLCASSSSLSHISLLVSACWERPGKEGVGVGLRNSEKCLKFLPQSDRVFGKLSRLFLH